MKPAPALDHPPLPAMGGELLFQNYQRAPVAFVRGRGARLWDTAGREYVDFLAGIATNALGHAHPRLVAALAEQASRVLHTSNLFAAPVQVKAASWLLGAAQAHLARPDESALARAFFCNSGTEANEAAIKLARKWDWRRAQAEGRAARYEIVSMQNAFHGRTLGALAATGTPKYHEGFAPLPQGFVSVPYGDLEAAERAITERTCAILVEPIQGEGGVIVPPEGYLLGLERLCRRHDLLFVLDEVQTGIGRLGGTMFAFQQMGLSPDAIVLAKGLGGGVPVGCLLARAAIASALRPGDHGSTFGGNPLAMAAVCAVQEAIAEEGVLERVPAAAERLRAGLGPLLRSGAVRELRGRGLMLALETDDAPAAARRALEAGVVVHAVRPTTVRLLPPLTIGDDEIDQGLERLRAAIGG